MAARTSSPSWWRVVAAFVLAPGLAALAVAPVEIADLGRPLLSRGFAGIVSEAFGIAISFAYPAMILLGVPTYFVLRGRIRSSALNCAVAGAVVALLPWLLLILVVGSANSRAELFYIVKETAVCGASGALAGLLFWAIAATGDGARTNETA